MNPEIHSLEYDSRRVRENSLFFAVQGAVTDGHLYLEEALKRGAVAVVSERPAPDDFPAAWVRVPSVRPLLALLADRFYGSPSRQLRLVGITGTNGKTTTAFLMHSILQRQGPSLLMGTIKTRVGGSEMDSVRTTPEAVDIQKMLSQALSIGCATGAMEVSSHALHFHRVYGCRFPVAVFTNLSQDHLDFHQNLENYFRSKCLLFDRSYNPGLEQAILNADDPFSRRIPLPPSVGRLTFGLSAQADIRPETFHTSLEGTRAHLKLKDRSLALESPLAGEHNLLNIMAAVAAASALGIPDPEIARGVAEAEPIPGRFERVAVPRPGTVIVDYAHTPQALENVLRLCRRLTRGRIICVFGCGGDRDRGKRPLMGQIAARAADCVILTSDNPRWEDPEHILEEIRAGIPAGSAHCAVVVDRRQAIARALEMVREGDLVLVAGKGHEAYQEIRGARHPFDDREVIRNLP